MWEHMYIDSPDKVGVVDIQVGQSWGGRWVKVGMVGGSKLGGGYR